MMLMVMAMTGEENVEDEASPGPSILYNDGTYIKKPSIITIITTITTIIIITITTNIYRALPLCQPLVCIFNKCFSGNPHIQPIK